MAPARILVVDSDSTARDLLKSTLTTLGHSVSDSTDARSALAVLDRERPDLIVCDLSLPDINGVEFLHDVRRREMLSAVRFVMTSDRKDTDDVLRAFESGADDFISKPIDRNELRARIGACLRRPATAAEEHTTEAGGILIDHRAKRVSVNGRYLSVAPREFKLLSHFLKHRDQVFSRDELLTKVWEKDVGIGPRTVDVHMRRLRILLEPSGHDHCLQTVRGSGYRFSLEG